MRVMRRLITAAAAALVVVLGAAPAMAADITLPDPGGAVVGLAHDLANSQLYAVSDVDGSTILVADEQGNRIDTVSYNASPQGVHALALYSGMLYIGDIAGERSEVTVYRVDPQAQSGSYQAYDFAYPDGNHDAKAMLISGRGRIYLITDGENPGIYRAELDPSRTSVNALTRAADAPTGVTDAVFLEDGATIVMRTADGIQAVDAYTWETLATTTYVGAPSGESLTTYGPGKLLVGGAELRIEDVPTGDSTVTISEPTPEASASEPTPEASPSEATEEAAPVVEDSTTTPSRGGTLIAIGAAALLSLACGLLVLLRR